MPTHQETLTAAQNVGFTPVNTKQEMLHLHSKLLDGELIHAIAEGLLKKIHGRDFNGIGLAILTDRRVIFYRRSVIGTETMEEIPLSKVSSFSMRKGMLLSSVVVVTSGNDGQLDQVAKWQAENFYKAGQLLLNAGPTPSAATSSGDRIGGLERLVQLRDSGALSQAEFEAEKQQLMAGQHAPQPAAPRTPAVAPPPPPSRRVRRLRNISLAVLGGLVLLIMLMPSKSKSNEEDTAPVSVQQPAAQPAVSAQPSASAPDPAVAKATQERARVEEKLKKQAQRDWPNDYTTQEYWINEELSAYDYMLTIPDGSVKRQAQRDWPLDFSTQKYWYNEQMEAKERLSQ